MANPVLEKGIIAACAARDEGAVPAARLSPHRAHGDNAVTPPDSAAMPPQASTRIHASSWPGLRSGWLPGLLLVAATLAVFWPALAAFPVRDDFAQIAYARLLGSPWPLFVHDHFIPAGAFFRPLGFAVLWLTTALAGPHLALHYLVAGMLHAAVALALYAVLRRAAPGRAAAWWLALLFALHPAAIGTSLWLADRFVLLAALCTLLALGAGWDYRRYQCRWQVLAALLLALLAMLAKETGLLVVPALGLLWLDLHRGRPRPAVPWPAILACVLLLPLYFAWRVAVLGGLGGGADIAAQPLPILLLKGFWAWLAHLPGYVSFWPRLSGWQQALLLLGAVLVALGWRVRRAPDHLPATHARLAWLLCGLAMFALPGLLQAPVAAISAHALQAEMSPLRTAMQSRLYYLAMAGLCIALAAAIGGRRHEKRGQFGTRAASAGMAVLVLLAGSASWNLARQYQQRSQAMRPLAAAAVAAVEHLPLPRPHCQIYFLDSRQPPESGLYTPLDSVVKALAPDIDRIGNCLIQTEAAPFFHLLRRGTLAQASLAPLTPLPGQAGNQPLLTIGNMEVAALNLTDHVDARTIGDAFFLAWRHGRFVDVTEAVRRGKLKVRFHCLRSAAACRPPAAAR